jgi:acetyl-CoA carboxylase carboxyltransferase component
MDVMVTGGRTGGSVTGGIALLGDRQVMLLQVDPAVRAGALSERDGEALARGFDLALEARVPVVAVLSSSGADVNEGVGALHGWGGAARAMARCSGIVPLLAIVTGPTLSGPALLLGLADVVIATPDAQAYLVGPEGVADFTGESVTAAALGGAGVLRRRSGVAALGAVDADGAMQLAGAVLAHLPDNCDEEAPPTATADPVDRPIPGAAAIIPPHSTGAYDVRDVIAGTADDGELLELWREWAANLVTAFITVEGRPVGVVANQPLSMAGTLDITASQKGARFVGLCDAFNLPIVTFVDTPGFLPGKDLEWRGMIRHGASLVAAYARATVPRVCVVLRKAYGGAYIVMDSRTMGNDYCIAWPTAEVAVMGAKGAVEIIHRRLDEAGRAAAEQEYAETLLTPWVAAGRGLVDAVIDPADTRREVAAALSVLRSKREHLPGRAHDTLPA